MIKKHQFNTFLNEIYFLNSSKKKNKSYYTFKHLNNKKNLQINL